MIKDGELSLEKIARYVPSLSMGELKEIEAEVMQVRQSDSFRAMSIVK